MKDVKYCFAGCLNLAMAWLLLVCLHHPAMALGTNYAACAKCGDKALVWSDGEFDQAHLVNASTAFGNLHPHSLPVDGLAKALLTLRSRTAAGSVSLLEKDAALRLAEAIVSALVKANANQEVLFLVTSGRGMGLFATRFGNSGRAFINADGLNVVFGEVNVDFVNQYRGTRRARTFEFGSREKASEVSLTSDNWTHPRNDWATIPLSAILANPSPRSQSSSFAATGSSEARDENYYAAQEVRLMRLKRLREQDLVSEEEYRSKRNEILREW